MDSDQPVNEKQEADRIVVGRINGAYGIKGWVKIFSYTDPIEKILGYTPWYMVRESRRGSRPQERGKKQAEDSILEFESGKVHGKGVIALPKGFKDRDQAESLRGFESWVGRRLLPPLETGDYYWHQLENLQVRNEQDECLGHVSHLLETGANDVLVVVPDSESIDDVERLIPYVEGKVVREIDVAEGKMLVDWASDY